MTSITNDVFLETSNNNVIKIPYSDNQEESILDTSIHINGFTIIELDEDKKEYNSLIPEFEDEQFLGKKQISILKSKANVVENYYAGYLDMPVPNVNCSKCLLGNFTANELLYFKDRKTLISYLKYCFIYRKKSLFVDHLIYKNNRLDLFQINQSYYNGWKFAFAKSICRSCFMQLINMEYLIFNIKNIICDSNLVSISVSPAHKKVSNFRSNKRRRPISKNKKPSTKKETINNEDKINDITSQITPIIISIPENEKVKKKRRRITNSVFKKRRKLKNLKKGNKQKYNSNIEYDQKNNALIINKKALGKYQIDEDSIIIGSILNLNKENEKENNKQNKKKEDKIKVISENKSELDSLLNKKTTKKEKKIEISSKDSSSNKDNNSIKNKNYQSKNINSKNHDEKNSNTIIINKINNNKTGEINMNKVGLIQINNENNFEINNCKNYSNKDDIIKLNLKQNNNNILINNLNNNNFNNYLNYRYISEINLLFSLNDVINENKINENLIFLKNYLIYISIFTQDIMKNLKTNSIGNITQYKIKNELFLKNLMIIRNTFNQIKIYMDYATNIIKSNIKNFQYMFNLDLNNFFVVIINLEKHYEYTKYLYTLLIEYCIKINADLKQVIDSIIVTKV